MDNLLSIVLWLPFAGALVLAVLPGRATGMARVIGLAFACLTFLFSIGIVTGFEVGNAGFQFIEDVPWIDAFGVRYSLGVDGISLWLVLLTTLLTPVVLLSSWYSIDRHVKAYIISMLVLETGMLGAFLATDLLLFYVFFEVMLVPMYLIIGVWGGKNRIYAAVKFFIFTIAGSLLMLLGIIYLVYLGSLQFGNYTFSIQQLYGIVMPIGTQTILFFAFALAFAIKVPVFPFHTWLPDAHVEAPTGGSIILAGVLLKLGTYGFVRFVLPFFPEATREWAWLLCLLAVIGVIYGALVAWVQPDMKKLVAYSSVSHLGFCVLGIFALQQTAITGSILQMVNHGLSTGALFLLVGVIYERRHTRMMEDFGGIARVAPIYTVLMVIAVLSSVGLPGLNGFVGEFLVLAGSFQTVPIYATIATVGVILAAIYLLWMVQRVFFGPITVEENRTMRDIRWNELVAVLPLILFIVWIGVRPGDFLRSIDPSVQALMQTISPEAGSGAIELRRQHRRSISMTLNPILEPNWMAAIAPEIILSLAGLLLILLEVFTPRLRAAFSSLTLISLVTASVVEWSIQMGDFFGGSYASTPLTRIFDLAFLLAAILVTMLSHDFLNRQGGQSGEYYALLVWSLVGMMMMAKGVDLLIVILGLELLSICLFAMLGYLRRMTLSSESSLKYFLMGAFATGFILYGIALFYGQTGSTNVRDIASWIVGQTDVPPIMTVGFVLFMAGVGFKLALVPFHAWAPDVYQGAPTPVAAWLSTAPKAATFLALINVLAGIMPSGGIEAWTNLLGLLAILSMVLGNLVATAQRDLKRMLAYSGIAHVGYMMIAITVLGGDAAASVAVYAVAYALMNIGAFGVIALLDKHQNESQTLNDIAGLGFRRPFHGIALTIFMLSLAGIPPTVGFAAKFFVFKVALESGAITIAVIGILTSIVSVFYYLRVVYYMYMREADEATPGTIAGLMGNGALALAVIGVLALGIIPGPLFDAARDAAQVLFQTR